MKHHPDSTQRQRLGAEIRAAAEEYIKKHRKPYAGGFEMPSSKEVAEHLAKSFPLSAVDIRRFFIYARSCTHRWSEGACPKCPE